MPNDAIEKKAPTHAMIVPDNGRFRYEQVRLDVMNDNAAKAACVVAEETTKQEASRSTQTFWKTLVVGGAITAMVAKPDVMWGAVVVVVGVFGVDSCFRLFGEAVRKWERK